MLINGEEFHIDIKKDVLTSVLERGYTVNHSCRDGRCGKCMIKVKNQNDINNYHACQYYPKQGDEIDFEYFEKFKLPNTVISPAKINEINVINDKFLTVQLRFPPGKFKQIIPGQYVEVTIPDIGSRSYSIFSMDLENNNFTLLIGKVKAGSASHFFFNQASKNILLTIKGSFGSFRFRPKPNITHIFCATGSGIAPINAILESVEAQSALRNNCKMHLFWSNTKASHFFELDVKKNKNLIVERYATQKVDIDKDVSDGRIIKPVIQLLRTLSDSTELNVYGCGNPNFVNDLEIKIQEIDNCNLNYFTDPFTHNGASK